MVATSFTSSSPKLVLLRSNRKINSATGIATAAVTNPFVDGITGAPTKFVYATFVNPPPSA